MPTEKFKPLDIESILDKLPLSVSGRIADLGCGNFGYFLFPLHRRAGSQAKIFALDVIPGHLEQIRRRLHLENIVNIETVLADLEKVGRTPLAEASLDGALLVNTLFQSEKRKEMLMETLRLLKSGGWLLVIERNILDPEIGPALHRRVSQDALIEAGKRLNLELVESFHPGTHYYGLLFLKK
jgi:ubiquinone/menaquinone biosynthesis C-methylase UbiE